MSILTRITDRKIPCVYTHVYHIMKNRRPGRYNSQRHAGSRKYFSGLSNGKSNESVYCEGSGKNLEMFLLRKR